MVKNKCEISICDDDAIKCYERCGEIHYYCTVHAQLRDYCW